MNHVQKLLKNNEEHETIIKSYWTIKDITETKHQAKKKFKTNGEILLLHQYYYVFKKFYVMAIINLKKVTP